MSKLSVMHVFNLNFLHSWKKAIFLRSVRHAPAITHNHAPAIIDEL